MNLCYMTVLMSCDMRFESRPVTGQRPSQYHGYLSWLSPGLLSLGRIRQIPGLSPVFDLIF